MATISHGSLLVIACILCVSAKLTNCMVLKTGCLGEKSDSSTDYSSSGCSDQSYESTPLCTTKRRVINPNDLIKSLNESWEFDRNFSQSIEVEVCENEGSSCNDYPTLKTRCRQRYLTIQLQVVTRNGTRRSQLKSFSIPSNCECIFYRQ